MNLNLAFQNLIRQHNNPIILHLDRTAGNMEDGLPIGILGEFGGMGLGNGSTTVELDIALLQQGNNGRVIFQHLELALDPRYGNRSNFAGEKGGLWGYNL